MHSESQTTHTSRSLTDTSASELARRIKAGDVSAREAVEVHIRRIEEVNPRLNAVVVALFDEARAEADAADAARARGAPLGPLHGVPITIKESFLVAGTDATLGLLNLRGRKAASDGPLVARLRRAGAIILGKTNVSQLVLYIESDNAVYGRTDNPWDPDRTPGGSSGGEAAIIAAGGSSLGLGGDLGGSIRIPAHFCGVHGLKPTSGRLTNADSASHPFPWGQEAIIPQSGPMARAVADLCLAMQVLVGPESERSFDLVPPVPWRDPANVAIETLRIGMYADDGFFRSAPALRRAVDEAARALRDRGATVEPFAPPEVERALHLFLAILSADGGAWGVRLLGKDPVDRRLKGLQQAARMPNVLRPVVARLVELGGQRYVPGILRHTGPRSTRDFWRLVEERMHYRQRFLSALDEGRFDAVICPPAALPALKHGSSEHLFPATSYAVLYNLLGMPAGVVAATRVQSGEESDRSGGKDLVERAARDVEQGSAGLPVGVQVAARHWREDVVLAVMGALEEHFRMRPDYPADPAAAGRLVRT